MIGKSKRARVSKRKATVPNLSSRSRTQAQSDLLNAGLSYSDSSQDTSDSGLNLNVASQSIAAGSTVLFGTTVSFVYYNYVAPYHAPYYAPPYHAPYHAPYHEPYYAPPYHAPYHAPVYHAPYHAPVYHEPYHAPVYHAPYHAPVYHEPYHEPPYHVPPYHAPAYHAPYHEPYHEPYHAPYHAPGGCVSNYGDYCDVPYNYNGLECFRLGTINCNGGCSVSGGAIVC